MLDGLETRVLVIQTAAHSRKHATKLHKFVKNTGWIQYALWCMLVKMRVNRRLEKKKTFLGTTKKLVEETFLFAVLQM